MKLSRIALRRKQLMIHIALSRIIRMVPTSEQLRAARAILGLDQQELAAAAGVSLATIRRAESAAHTLVSSENLTALRSVLERLGVLFIDAGKAAPRGGTGVRLATSEGVALAAPEFSPKSHDKTIISTQQEWERARPRNLSESSIREFLRRYGFNPESLVERGQSVGEAMKPRVATIRREIYDKCFDVTGRTVREVNQIARQIGGTSVRKDADLVIGLHSGYVRLAGPGATVRSGSKK